MYSRRYGGAERSTELTPVGDHDGIDGLSRKDVPAPGDGTSRRPEYGFVASRVITVGMGCPTRSHVEPDLAQVTARERSR